MLVEKVLQTKKDLMTLVDNWSNDDEQLLIFEKNDTLVLKKMKKGLAAFADDSYNDEMNLEEVVAEVHKVRHQ